MSKGKSSLFQTSNVSDDNIYFVNSAGKSFKLRGLPPLVLPELSNSITKPKKPTYQVTTASGDTETHDHDETTLSTPEDQLAWAEYVETLRKNEEELSNRMLTCILIEGIDIPDGTDFARWETRQRLMGFAIPEEYEEKLLLYKKSEVIRSADDIRKLMAMVMALTGIRQEDIDNAKSSFPDQMESES